jgi:hypothetical protein
MELRVVLTDLYAEKAQVEKAIAALEALNNTAGTTAAPVRRGRKPGMSAPAATSQTTPTPSRRGRRKMSPAARKRISEAAKKRWAERKASTPARTATAAKKTAPARHMSAAARRRISEAAKKRWAARRAKAA